MSGLCQGVRAQESAGEAGIEKAYGPPTSWSYTHIAVCRRTDVNHCECKHTSTAAQRAVNPTSSRFLGKSTEM